jgi:hypothetical protein
MPFRVDDDDPVSRTLPVQKGIRVSRPAPGTKFPGWIEVEPARGMLRFDWGEVSVTANSDPCLGDPTSRMKLQGFGAGSVPGQGEGGVFGDRP